MKHWFLGILVVSLAIPKAFAEEELSAEVSWLNEVIQGGMTSLALGVLIMVMIASVVERFSRLRPQRFVPEDLKEKARSLWEKGQHEELMKLSANDSSIFGKVIHFVTKYSAAEADLLFSGAADIINRSMRGETQKNSVLSVSAALAPLLGLLGTMIGMIESFKLVELYGDEGGASMLAGSISKALITTALGLIIAICALACYNFFKARITNMTLYLEEEVESLLNEWFLLSKTPPPRASKSSASKRVVAQNKTASVQEQQKTGSAQNIRQAKKPASNQALEK
ncbi:MAG: MotA/TolQ/ExbB proton channel family protein [Planctomycetes bacterium]|nr:MotA/TolQ/ExbB proton channel family protein [Planctomycetota bacterium]